MKIRSFVLILLWVLALASVRVEAEFSQTASTNVEPEQQLTLEQKVGQLFLFGFSETKVTPEFSQFLTKVKPGGFIVFGRNIQTPSQISGLLFNIQTQAVRAKQIPFFLAVDQEGGTVTRIKSFPFPPSSMAIGNTNNLSYAKEVGRSIGRMLKVIGFNMNLAPVLDLASADENSFIGTRAYGREPKLVSHMAGALAAGLSEQNIIATGKHFPGHGLISADSHLILPKRDITLEQLLETDLKPFDLLHDQLPALMVAHIAYPKIDPSGLPATYSSILLSKVLRERLGFNGLIVTDDIEMAGAKQVGSISQRAIRAIQAGADLVMIGWNRREQMNAVLAVTNAVRSGQIPMARIEASLARILKAKAKFGVFDPPKLSSVSDIQKTLFDPKFKSLVDKIVLENIGLSTHSIRLSVNTSEPFVVMSISPDFFDAFKNNVKSQDSRFFRLSREKSKQDLEKVFRLYPKSYFVFYVTGTSSATLLKKISGVFHKRMIVVNTLTPANIATSDPYLIEFNTFTKHIEMGRFVAAELQKDMGSSVPTDDRREPAEEFQLKEVDPKADDL